MDERLRRASPSTDRCPFPFLLFDVFLGSEQDLPDQCTRNCRWTAFPASLPMTLRQSGRTASA